MVWLCRLGLVETLNPKPHAPRAALSSYIRIYSVLYVLGRCPVSIFCSRGSPPREEPVERSDRLWSSSSYGSVAVMVQ